MPRDSFQQSKDSVLSRKDKSSIGEWDKKVKSLCDKINFLDDFYTTSSCSGRVVLMIEQDKKDHDLFFKMSHDLISFEWIKNSLKEILDKNKNQFIKFKLEQPIFHIACRNIESAEKLLDKALHIGFKRSGIINLGKKVIVELNSTEKLEFPIILDGKVLVGDDFIELIVKISNEKLKKGWMKIQKLEKLL